MSMDEFNKSQKACRVCGDHATGYNFNVISCESCKAFFRRNAKRPKEFKCPYSGDCEINAVSRRFCQLCRLKKCFNVGMRKDWILNEEQLKRRKNSRLKPIGGLRHLPSPPETITNAMQHPMLPSTSSIRNPSPETNVIKRELIGDTLFKGLIESDNYGPPSFSSMLEPCSTRLPGNITSAHEMISPKYERARGRQISDFICSLSSSPSYSMRPQSIETSPDQTPISEVQIQPNLQQMTNVSVDEYPQQYLQSHITQPQPIYAPMPFSMLPSQFNTDNKMIQNEGIEQINSMISPIESPAQSSSQMSSPSSSLFPFLEWSPTTVRFMEESIKGEIESHSPGDLIDEKPTHIEFKETFSGDLLINYQLNSSELCELDVVRNAYSCMNEPVNDSKDKETLNITDHTPGDVMNIIDIIMRRFVKMTKKLPAFNTLSQDAKLALLKSAMIKMVTFRGVGRFDPKSLSFNSNLSGRQNISISCKVFDKLNDSSQKSNFIKFCFNIHDVVKRNDMVINLIGLIVLFENASILKNDTDRALAQKYNKLYYNLLRRYVESVHGKDANQIMESIPYIIDGLNRLCTVAETIFVGKVNPNDGTRKLPMEFFKTRSDDVQSTNQPTSSA